MKIVGLWKKAGPNPNPNPKPQTPLPALGVREGQVSVWGSQLGLRLRKSIFRAEGPSYLKNFPPHSDPLDFAGNTPERLCPKNSPFGKTFFLSFLGPRETCIYILVSLAISKRREKGRELQQLSKCARQSESQFFVGWRCTFVP